MAKPTRDRLYAGRSAVPAAARAVLRGDLAKVGLATVLTIVDLEQRTGVLLVKHGGRQSVQLEVAHGQVVRARHTGRGPTGLDAVLLAIGWTTGQFELYSVAVEPGDEIGMRTTFLLMEAARRIDEPNGSALLDKPRGADECDPTVAAS